MKEASWEDCIESNSSIRRIPDKLKARSLVETAKGRIEYASKSILNEENANYIFEDYYSSLLEFLHALTILEGFIVNNHICIGYFLKDVLKRSDLFIIFDDCRFKRNSLVYYGKKMDFETSKKCIENIKRLITEFEKIIQNKM